MKTLSGWRLYVISLLVVAAPLPHRGERIYSRDELDRLHGGAGADYLKVQVVAPLVGALTGRVPNIPAIEVILDRGVNGDVYDSLINAVQLLSRNNAVENASSSSIPANAGVTRDDNQPFPVFGWLEVKWMDRPAAISR